MLCVCVIYILHVFNCQNYACIIHYVLIKNFACYFTLIYPFQIDIIIQYILSEKEKLQTPEVRKFLVRTQIKVTGTWFLKQIQPSLKPEPFIS